ncbi:hypothetical protein [uncultured Sphingomonas sp.]|uniref:hypothetical protein n=1 Tax=uncultured Sphingomonas sp. TaxID=158754 RepID=UPI0035CC70D2
MLTQNGLTGNGNLRTPGRLSFLALEIFPFLLIPVLVYNLFALLAGSPLPGTDSPRILAGIDNAAVAVTMLSGVRFRLSWGDVLLVFSIIFLFVEVLKSTRTYSPAIVNHMASMALFIFCLIEFLLFPNYSTSTFFLLTMMVLVDALAGMIVTIVSARRDFGVEGVS